MLFRLYFIDSILFAASCVSCFRMFCIICFDELGLHSLPGVYFFIVAQIAVISASVWCVTAATISPLNVTPTVKGSTLLGSRLLFRGENAIGQGPMYHVLHSLKVRHWPVDSLLMSMTHVPESSFLEYVSWALVSYTGTYMPTA